MALANASFTYNMCQYSPAGRGTVCIVYRNLDKLCAWLHCKDQPERSRKAAREKGKKQNVASVGEAGRATAGDSPEETEAERHERTRQARTNGRRAETSVVEPRPVATAARGQDSEGRSPGAGLGGPASAEATRAVTEAPLDIGSIRRKNRQKEGATRDDDRCKAIKEKEVKGKKERWKKAPVRGECEEERRSVGATEEQQLPPKRAKEVKVRKDTVVKGVRSALRETDSRIKNVEVRVEDCLQAGSNKHRSSGAALAALAIQASTFKSSVKRSVSDKCPGHRTPKVRKQIQESDRLTAVSADVQSSADSVRGKGGSVCETASGKPRHFLCSSDAPPVDDLRETKPGKTLKSPKTVPVKLGGKGAQRTRKDSQQSVRNHVEVNNPGTPATVSSTGASASPTATVTTSASVTCAESIASHCSTSSSCIVKGDSSELKTEVSGDTVLKQKQSALEIDSVVASHLGSESGNSAVVSTITHTATAKCQSPKRSSAILGLALVTQDRQVIVRSTSSDCSRSLSCPASVSVASTAAVTSRGCAVSRSKSPSGSIGVIRCSVVSSGNVTTASSVFCSSGVRLTPTASVFSSTGGSVTPPVTVLASSGVSAPHTTSVLPSSGERSAFTAVQSQLPAGLAGEDRHCQWLSPGTDTQTLDRTVSLSHSANSVLSVATDSADIQHEGRRERTSEPRLHAGTAAGSGTMSASTGAASGCTPARMDADALRCSTVPDDRSDSGVSGLRSDGARSSGDERSGSRSSALSIGDDSQRSGSRLSAGFPEERSGSADLLKQGLDRDRAPLTVTLRPEDSAFCLVTDKKKHSPCPSLSPLLLDKREPVRVWRDPNLMNSDQPIRHIHSLQHQTIMSQHPGSVYPTGVPTSAPSQPGSSPLPQHPLPLSHYPTHLMGPPHLASLSHNTLGLPPHLLAGQYSLAGVPPEVLWKQQYMAVQSGPHGPHLLPPGPGPGHHSEEMLLDRERVLVQERDRQLRDRERREHEARERERQEKDRQEREKQERDRIAQERAKERQERERTDRERVERERLTRERKEREERLEQERDRQERMDQERLEKQLAAEQAVNQHFEISLGLAQQKRNIGWSPITSLPPHKGPHQPVDPSHLGEEERRREVEQRRVEERYLVERARQRQEEALRQDRNFFGSQMAQRPSGAQPKTEYPPPAHSGSKPGEKSSGPTLPQAEPNFSVVNYPYQQMGHVKQEKIKSGAVNEPKGPATLPPAVKKELPTPPPLTSDKGSVIVQSDGKTIYEKVPPHSISPKVRSTSESPHHYPPHSSGAFKPYEQYSRSPSQSPHSGVGVPHHSHHHAASPHHVSQLEPQNLASRPGQPRSNPSPAHNLSQSHPSPPERGVYGGSPYAPPSSKVPATYSYSLVQQGLVSNQLYNPVTVGTTMGTSSTVATKPKVSSPVPQQIYGKPGSGISTGTPVCRTDMRTSSPLPLVSQANRGVPANTLPPGTGPPPAHSHHRSHPDSRPVDVRGLDHRPYEPRVYPHSQVTSAASPAKTSTAQGSHIPTVSSSVINPARTMPSTQAMPGPPGACFPLPNHQLQVSPAVQTQPLDLGLADRNREDMTSPKRKAMISMDVNGANKKRKTDTPPHSQPVLARVSEPSPLMASAATTITTVVNTAAYTATTNTAATSQGTTITALAATPVTLAASTVNASSTFSTQHGENIKSSAPVTTSSRNSPLSPVLLTPVQIQPSRSQQSTSPVTSQGDVPQAVTPKPSTMPEKSSSPVPARAGPSYALKKRWIQRHEDTKEVAGISSPNTGTNSNNSINSSSTAASPAPSASAQSPVPTPTPTETPPPPPRTPPSSSRRSPPPKPVGTNKNPRKLGKEKGADSTTLNGLGADSSTVAEETSSSASDAEAKAPPKRKPPKVKRKKGGKEKQDTKRKKGNSDSHSESEKESGSEKESDGEMSNNSKKSGKDAGNDGKDPKEPRKRGRRPKSKNEGSSKDKEEPKSKKPKEDPPQKDPFQKPPVSQLKKTGETFLQDGPCFEVAPKLAKCRECRWTPHQRNKKMPNIFCRFYAFRRLRYTKNGQLAIAGFSDPHKDATEDDLKLWLPNSVNPPQDLDVETVRFLMTHVGDKFCELVDQEKEAVSLHMAEDKTVSWKRVVQGVREMCDVCETTLFNFHWACAKCGFVVCIDCYKGRQSGTIKVWREGGKDRDEYLWLFCTNRMPHEQEKLMLTQIIAGNALLDLGACAHEMRHKWGVPQYCGCSQATLYQDMDDSKKKFGTNGICKELVKNVKHEKGEPLNGMMKSEKKTEDKKNGKANGAVIKQGESNSPLRWLADVAISSEEKKESDDSGDSSDSDDDKGDNFGSTLRELLIRPSNKPSSSKHQSPKKSRLDTLDEVISCVIEQSVDRCDERPQKKVELKHFVRRYAYPQNGREPLPIRIMTLTESTILYPDCPHSWLCGGKMLRLHDCSHEGNYRIFQDQWKRGQPVMVSDVGGKLDMSLWHPDAFCRDFGDVKIDLINCVTGNIVPNQPMRKFWEGFERFSRRLKDDSGEGMLLKMKDWPPTDDFADILPSRFNDLTKKLPLPEYTQRGGQLNLAGRLPDCFVKPDLGPKMYIAYGSATNPSIGSTNLHLDMSDAVNVMVYVGIAKDRDDEQHMKEALRAIDEAGCDILTRRRVREKNELPGALWHIYNPRDADKIRDLLNKVAMENGKKLEPHHDPIHDQSWFLDTTLRERLYKEYAVDGYSIVQCAGDAIFIPAGAPHQVRNLHNCIKVAEDFVSPENVAHCFHLTQEFRDLTETHINHEDKLQIKNIIYHAMKDTLSVLGSRMCDPSSVSVEVKREKDS